MRHFEKIKQLRAAIDQIYQRDSFHCDAKGADNSRAIIHPFLREPPAGEYFLCDCIGNTVDLCLATNRKYRNSEGRMVNCKVIETLIPDCHARFGTALNGCWQIPWHLIK